MRVCVRACVLAPLSAQQWPPLHAVRRAGLGRRTVVRSTQSNETARTARTLRGTAHRVQKPPLGTPPYRHGWDPTQVLVGQALARNGPQAVDSDAVESRVVEDNLQRSRTAPGRHRMVPSSGTRGVPANALEGYSTVPDGMGSLASLQYAVTYS